MMGIRACALETPAFAQLLQAYQNREEAPRAFCRSGGKVVAKLGFDVPDELILAAGMMPVQVYADPARPLKKTDVYLEFAFDPMVRGQFEKLVDGTCAEQADFLAVSNSTDVIIRVYLYLREIQRQNLEALPPMTFLDWLFTRNRLHQERNELTVKLFMEQLEQWSGAPLTEEAIRQAMEVCNADRQALRRIGALRHSGQPRISGSEALVIIGSAGFMDRQTHTRLTEEVASAAASWPALTGKRIFFTGSAQEDTRLYDWIEQTGAVVVGEDHDWGDRYYDRDCSLSYPPVRAIVDRYMLREFSSKKAFVSQRVEALDRQVDAAEAQAVIFYSNLYEEAASWDYPSQKASLEARGIPTRAFAKMHWPAEKNPGLREQLAEFCGE